MRIAIGLVLVVLAGVGHPGGPLAFAGRSQSSPDTHTPRLFKDSRQLLAIARAQGRQSVTLVVATREGRIDRAVQDAVRLGGEVRHRDDEIGYLRVRLPIDNATVFAESSAIDAAAADADDSYPSRLLPSDSAQPTAMDGSAELRQAPAPGQWPPVPGDYPLRHPYSAVADLGAAELRATSPTFDGRGVTIALLDGNLDLLLPEYQTAYTLAGARVPKIADFLNVTDPRDDAGLNPQWVDMHAEVDAANGRASFQGKTFAVPRPGRYRIGLFDERRFNQPANLAYLDQDVDRDGNPAGDDGLFGVLWDERTNDVWVDTNRDLSFTGEKPMTDYARRQEVGVFGKDDPTTPVRESTGFAVQTDAVNKFISINLGVYQHASEIMGGVVGNREPNGRLGGVAPGARVVSMFYGVGALHAAIEGLIRAFRHPAVDLIVFEQSVAMASIPYLLADARHPLSVIAQRLTERYQKLMFVPGSNSPGFGIVAEDGLAPGVVSVGGYQSRASYLANWGIAVEDADNLHWGGLSHGPSGTGALKPDLLAPSGQISTDVGYRAGASRKGLYQLPAGYAVDGGTSTATPMAAGAAALVVSAAKQRNIKYDAMKLKAALMGSARYISRFAAHEQGAGLIQVGAAFDLLQTLQSAPTVTIISRAPVRTALSSLLTPPNEGVGLYEREGWKPGDRGERTVTLTRTSGPADTMRFALRWSGNDGTFSSAESIALPLNQAVAVPVTISVTNPGAHSALLTLTHPSLAIPAHRVLCTVVAALPLNASNTFSASTTIAVPKPSDRSVFVDVPPGTAALQFAAASADGPVRLDLVSPERDYLYACPTPPTSAPCAMARPSPGVWEINVANNDMTFDEAVTRAAKPKQVKVTATAMAVDVEAGALAAEGFKAGGAVTFPVRFTNRLGATPSLLASGETGSAYQTARTIAQGAQDIYWITVPSGAGLLRASIHAADPRADLDVYLLNCTTLDRRATPEPDRAQGGKRPAAPPPPCTPRAKAASLSGDGSVYVADPAPGRWAVVVDAYAVPGGSTTYEYRDGYTHPRFGAMAVSADVSDRSTGGVWSASAHAWAASLPDAPRLVSHRIAVMSRSVTETVRLPEQRQVVIPLGWLDLVADGR